MSVHVCTPGPTLSHFQHLYIPTRAHMKTAREVMMEEAEKRSRRSALEQVVEDMLEAGATIKPGYQYPTPLQVAYYNDHIIYSHPAALGEGVVIAYNGDSSKEPISGSSLEEVQRKIDQGEHPWLTGLRALARIIRGEIQLEEIPHFGLEPRCEECWKAFKIAIKGWSQADEAKEVACQLRSTTE
jgi:hypothetical protein